MAPPPAADGSAAGLDGISRVISEAAALFGSYEIVITPAATREDGGSNAKIIEWQAAAGRDLLAITPELQEAAEAALAEAFTAMFDEGLPLARAIPMLGNGVLDHLVGRLENSGPEGPPDVGWTEDAESTIKRKGHAVVLVDTGDLTRGLIDATVTTRKV